MSCHTFSLNLLLILYIQDETLLHIACQFPYIDEDLFEDCYNTNPGAIDKQDSEGNTPLHWAVQGPLGAEGRGKADIQKVMFLVDKGADINAENNRGETPIQIAGRKRHDKVVKYLRSQGANFSEGIVFM